jgi:hypothetical protein
MKTIRQLHLYLGLFFAPSILFFAFTGALQTFSLHENKEPGSHNPEWISKLAEIHKDQRLPRTTSATNPSAVKPVRPESPAVASAKSISAPGSAQRKPSLPLKIFVLLMAVGLTLSSFLGIYMAFKYNRGRGLIWGLLIAGIVLPLLLLYM